MQRLATLAAALVSAALAAGMAFGTPLALADEEIYDACRGSEERIVAAELPDTVDLDRCPVEGRVITDGEVGSVLPDPGEGVYAEVLTTSGAQELEIFRSRAGTLELDHVGDDSDLTTGEPTFDAAARRSGACSDRAYNDGEGRVESDLPWSFNRSTVPDELTIDSAEDAIRRAGTNITNMRNSCRLADRVPAEVGLPYAGNTNTHADISRDSCLANDDKSVVSFGDLANGILAGTCNWKGSGVDYEPIEESDIKINKADFNWTTRPDARSCRKRFDLEGVMTHERGHTFGLLHVGENRHGAQTMSIYINGTCQSAERTLGRGDVLGLGNKYREF
jgi:hypothetical protein